MQTSKRDEIIDEYESALEELMDRLAEIDKKHGAFARIEIENLNVSSIGDRLRRYVRNIRLMGLYSARSGHWNYQPVAG